MPHSFNRELIYLVVMLIVIGVLLWLVNNYLPMDQKHSECGGDDLCSRVGYIRVPQLR